MSLCMSRSRPVSQTAVSTQIRTVSSRPVQDLHANLYGRYVVRSYGSSTAGSPKNLRDVVRTWDTSWSAWVRRHASRT